MRKRKPNWKSWCKKGVGVDISDKLINLAKKKFPKVHFYCNDIISDNKKLSSEGKFDFILISDTIGYFHDIQKYLESIHFLQTRNKNYNFLFLTYMATNSFVK